MLTSSPKPHLVLQSELPTLVEKKVVCVVVGMEEERRSGTPEFWWGIIQSELRLPHQTLTWFDEGKGQKTGAM